MSSVVGKMRVEPTEAGAFCRDRMELSLIAVLEPVDAGGVADFEGLGPVDAHARLFGSTFAADHSRPVLSKVIDMLATVVETTPVGLLRVPRRLDGLRAAESVLRTVLGDAASPAQADPIRDPESLR